MKWYFIVLLTSDFHSQVSPHFRGFLYSLEPRTLMFISHTVFLSYTPVWAFSPRRDFTSFLCPVFKLSSAKIWALRSFVLYVQHRLIYLFLVWLICRLILFLQLRATGTSWYWSGDLLLWYAKWLVAVVEVSLFVYYPVKEFLPWCWLTLFLDVALFCGKRYALTEIDIYLALTTMMESVLRLFFSIAFSTVKCYPRDHFSSGQAALLTTRDFMRLLTLGLGDYLWYHLLNPCDTWPGKHQIGLRTPQNPL